ncbi:hypothetical protein O3U67_15850 [Brevundimonas diminuta]|uniref:hypothetical protein n=1 Tax=Brevundimonas diminuta TaxID=293 RepID=UPI0022AF547D|nr:hypothetical protein [Brevundimonas diminuta]MCZ4109564.1 hypothetical protein [Brevundimonas diminuta]
MTDLSNDARRYAEGLKRDVADWQGDDDLRLGAAQTLLKQEAEIAELRADKEAVIAMMKLLVTMPAQRAKNTMTEALRQMVELREKRLKETAR